MGGRAARNIKIDEDEEDNDSESLVQNDGPAQRKIDNCRQWKRTQQTRYRSMKHLHATTNSVERLFSKAKFVMTDIYKYYLCFYACTIACGMI